MCFSAGFLLGLVEIGKRARPARFWYAVDFFSQVLWWLMSPCVPQARRAGGAAISLQAAFHLPCRPFAATRAAPAFLMAASSTPCLFFVFVFFCFCHIASSAWGGWSARMLHFRRRGAPARPSRSPSAACARTTARTGCTGHTRTRRSARVRARWGGASVVRCRLSVVGCEGPR